MDYQDIIVSCKNCEMKVPMSKMKPSKEGPHLICLKCYESIYGLHDEKIMQSADPNRINYVCGYCNYKFSRTKDLCVEVCPYCGKANLGKDQAATCSTPKTKKLSDY